MQLGQRRSPAGWASETQEKYEDITHSLRTMADFVDAGLFVPVGDSTWDYELHFDSLEDWVECLERPWCGGSETNSALIDTAGRDPTGRIVLIQENLAQIYQKS